MMEAVRTSKTSVYAKETIRRYIPDGFNIHVYTVRESYKIHENKTELLTVKAPGTYSYHSAWRG
jgi:hypothetical protein